MKTQRYVILASALATFVASTAAKAADPKLVPGKDPAGTAVAILADGFDYTRADLAKVLARDGEGEAIAWDTIDGDHRPFAREAAGTDVALALAKNGAVRTVLVRVGADPATLAKAIAFTATTPARIAVVPLAAEDRKSLDVLNAASKRFAEILFVGSVPEPTTEEKALGDTLPNLILFDSANDGHAAAQAVARALGCERAAPSGTSGTALKTELLARLQDGAGTDCGPAAETKQPK